MYNAYSNEAAVKAANHHNIINDDLFFAGLTAINPEALMELWGKRRWAVHRNKIPFNPLSGINAKSNDPRTCVLFSDANAALDEYDGVEFLLGDGLCGIDLDHCIDPETGKVNAEALRIVDILDSYAELSPSGTGIHILVRGEMPFTGRQGSRDAAIQIEMYSEYRFFTITGNAINDKPVSNRTKEIMELADQFFPVADIREKPAAIPSPLDTDNDQKMILSALDAIDPTDCDYNQWLRVGLGIMEAGLGPDTWDLWSSNDQKRYKPGECAKKWRTFNDKGQNSSGPGIIIALAKENGWEPGDAFTENEKEEYFKQKALAEIQNLPVPMVSDNTPFDEDMTVLDGEDKHDAETYVDSSSLSDRTLSAIELLNIKIKKPDYFVEDLLPVGGTILAGPPKAGKSLLALEIATLVSLGEEFLGLKTKKAPVLYLALEDSFARITERLKKQGLAEKCIDSSPEFCIRAPIFGDKLIDKINKFIEENGRSLIIIDTLQRIRPNDVRGVSEYKQDYPLLTELSSLAREKESAILLIHHTRKTEDPNNPFNMINGSVAIQGATDAMMVITRDKQQFQKSRATLHVTGRDIGLNDIEMAFMQPTLTWLSEKELESKSRRLLFDNDPIITVLRTIMEEIENDNNLDEKVYIATAQDILSEAKKTTNECSTMSAKQCGSVIRSYIDLLAEEGIAVETPEKTVRLNGGPGRYYKFSLIK